MQDLKGGLSQLRNSLEEEFKTTRPAFTRALTPSQIEQRLKFLWADRLESLNLKASDIQIFYEQGLSTLDWDKLVRKPIGKAYSARQIEHFKQQHSENEEPEADSPAVDDEDDQQVNSNGKRWRPAQSSDIESSSDEDPIRGPRRRRARDNSQAKLGSHPLSKPGSKGKVSFDEQEIHSEAFIQRHDSRYSVPTS